MNSSTMTPDEIAQIRTFGEIFLFDLNGAVAASILYGMVLLVTGMGLFVLLQKRRQKMKDRDSTSKPANTVYIITVIVSFILATLFWGQFIAGFSYSIRATLVDNPEMDIGKLNATDNVLYPLDIIGNVASQLMPLITDAFIVWRASLLFRDNRKMMIAPVLLLLADAVMNVVYLAYTATISGAEISQQGESRLFTNVWTSILALSLATNAAASLLMLWKFWRARQVIFQKRPYSKAQRVLLILFESGVIFCAFQIVVLGLTQSSFVPLSSFNLGTAAMVDIYSIFSAMYPTVVLVLINSIQESPVEFIQMDKSLMHANANAARPRLGLTPIAFGSVSEKDTDVELGTAGP